MANKWGGGPANYYGTSPYGQGSLRDRYGYGAVAQHGRATEQSKDIWGNVISMLPFFGGGMDFAKGGSQISQGDLLSGLGNVSLGMIGALPFGGIIKKAGGSMADLLKRSNIEPAPLAIRPKVDRVPLTISSNQSTRSRGPSKLYEPEPKYEPLNPITTNDHRLFPDTDYGDAIGYPDGYLEDLLNQGENFNPDW